MKTTVMFVADSVPLNGAEVWLVGGGDDDRGTTDSEGKVEFDLTPGTHTFRVRVDDSWQERTIKREGDAPLFVVNLQQNAADRMSSLNTLQIDLANVVGDRYEFETVLGRGGMGVVIKAIDRMLNRPVAIKMLSDELRDNEEAQQIFLVEARNLATLNHPNLVAIHDILNIGGRVLMVFEYVLGENVENLLKKNGRMKQLEALRLAVQLTRCVAYLHEHDLIHRDLKPANIIAQADGTMKVIDFGLSRSLNEIYVRGTRVRGTPAYMAPEQVQGVHLTTATDIYQLGITFYEILSGSLPFTTGDMAYAHVHLEAAPLTDVVPDLDPELARLVHTCLEKRPRDRPASADVLLEHLSQIYARLSTGTRPGLEAVSSPSFIELSVPEELGDLSEVSIVEELAGGSNRGLILVALIGIGALVVAAGLLLRPSDTPPPQEPVVSAPVKVEEPVVVAEPEPPPVEEAVSSARREVMLGAAVAKSEGAAVAVVEAEEPPTAQAAVQRRPTSSSKPAKKAESSKPAKTREPSPPEQKTETKTQNGLLSVDSGSGSKLLPVGK